MATIQKQPSELADATLLGAVIFGMVAAFWGGFLVHYLLTKI